MTLNQSKCWPLVFLSMAAGCGSPEKVEKLPLTGSVSLQFVRMSPSGIHLRLANQGYGVISFRGTRESDLGVSPWDTLLECKSSDSDVWLEAPFGLADGGPASVSVPPGEQVDLVVEDKLVDQYKGGRCHLSVRLEGGSFIQSDDFEP